MAVYFPCPSMVLQPEADSWTSSLAIQREDRGEFVKEENYECSCFGWPTSIRFGYVACEF